MGMLGAFVGRKRRFVGRAGGNSPRLAVRTRCVVVADLVEIDQDGTRNVVLSGVNDQVARDLYRELTGRPWTGVEAR